jgi:hypothetical protein
MLKTTIPYQTDTFLVVQEGSRIMGVIPMVEGEEDYGAIITQIVQEHYSADSVLLYSAIHKGDYDWEYGGTYASDGELFEVTVRVDRVAMYGRNEAKAEPRVYGIDVNDDEERDYDINTLSDLDFSLEAQYEWSLAEFQKAFNADEIVFSNIFIRHIFPNK